MIHFCSFAGLLVGYVVLRDRRSTNLSSTKRILILILASLFTLALVLTVVKQVNQIESGQTWFNCSIKDYTKSCQRQCFNRNVTYYCPVSFCYLGDI